MRPPGQLCWRAFAYAPVSGTCLFPSRCSQSPLCKSISRSFGAITTLMLGKAATDRICSRTCQRNKLNSRSIAVAAILFAAITLLRPLSFRWGGSLQLSHHNHMSEIITGFYCCAVRQTPARHLDGVWFVFGECLQVAERGGGDVFNLSMFSRAVVWRMTFELSTVSIRRTRGG